MLRSMNSAISGMQAFQTDLDVVGNNIANVDTVGYKSNSAEFSDVLSQTMAGGNAGSTTAGGVNPEQVGLGVKVAATQMDMSQGADSTTGVATNVAIQGNGFFVVTDGTHDYLTRAGDFSIDSAGNLVLPDGTIALGYATAPSSSSTTAPTTKMNVLTLAGSGSQVSNVTIGSDGSITASVTDSSGSTTTKTLGYLALAQVPNPAGLVKTGDNLYDAQSAPAGSATYWTPGQGSYGTLAAGELEQSNVDLSQQFAEMIVAQNAYVANTHMIGTDNAILQALVNMKNS
ncbi:flagellar basal body protein [Alicyclobacillus hesperidum subsp. aegles]|uniref:flagellar hook-basal body complex protein n=1 Tax=Alicyclobacillus hesperidum TaxID=89784 RepID=UPI00222D6DDD|nr:flagellar hook-basal body complex protein [Alicyclobacillus hesperidum]GLG00567.1 flagellar basal body protein [Alicyclobacillus hesperidum subsp. aegles]